MGTWRTLIFGFGLAASLSIAAPACAQEPSLSEVLTGGDARVWVLRSFRVSLGGEERCEDGETWRFGADHQVEIATCENNTVVRRTHTWAVVSEDDLDSIIRVGAQRFYIRVYPERITFRTVVTSAITPRGTREFRLEGAE